MRDSGGFLELEVSLIFEEVTRLIKSEAPLQAGIRRGLAEYGEELVVVAECEAMICADKTTALLRWKNWKLPQLLEHIQRAGAEPKLTRRLLDTAKRFKTSFSEGKFLVVPMAKAITKSLASGMYLLQVGMDQVEERDSVQKYRDKIHGVARKGADWVKPDAPMHIFSGPDLCAPHRLRAIPRPKEMVGSPLPERLVRLLNIFDNICGDQDRLCLGDGQEEAKRAGMVDLGPLRVSAPGYVALQLWHMAKKISALKSELRADTEERVVAFIKAWGDQYGEMEATLRRNIPPPAMEAVEECWLKLGQEWEAREKKRQSDGP